MENISCNFFGFGCDFCFTCCFSFGLHTKQETSVFPQTDSKRGEKFAKLALAELQEPGADPAKHPVISSLSA